MASSAASRPDWGALVAAASVLLLSGLAWYWQARQAVLMAAMGDMRMPPTHWLSGEGLLALVMWLVMMQAMMLPAALPMILLYRRCLQRDRQRVAKLWLFCAAYGLMWCGFALLLTGLQALGERVGVLEPMDLRLPPALGGLVLLVAGLYQLSRAKAVCLEHCQSPLQFLQHHARPGLGGAWLTGLHHGLYCLGCCWALMLILLVLGAMSLWGMALLSLLVLAEKLLPLGTGWRRASAALLIGSGVWLLVQA
jgi:predicted metal-binding membrane protein